MTTAELDVEEDVEGEGWDAPAEILEADLDAVADLDDVAPIVVSAFAGVGGIDTGFERAGFQTGVQIEWDAAASRVLAARFPHAVRFGDVRTVDGDAVRHALGGRRCRVLVGGFPCQDLSVAGRRAGMAGERSGLYGELLRLAAELDPDWLVVENVPGLLSADADPEANDGAGVGPGSGFALFLGDLTGFYGAVPANGWRSSGVCHGPLGTCAWRVLDARHAGVAQRRRRVFVVFCPRDRLAPAAVLLEPEGVRRNPASRVPSWQGAAAAALDPALRGGEGDADGRGAGGPPSPNGVEQVSTLTSSLGKGGPDAAHALAGWMVPAEKMPSGMPMSARVELGETAPTLMAQASEGRGGTDAPMILDRRAEAEREGITTAAETGFAAWRESELSGPLEARGAKSAKTVVAYAPETAATLTAGTSSPGVSAPGRRQEDDVNLVAKMPNAAGIARAAYEVDKERGMPNGVGIKVTETDVAPTITADGDPAERTDRGLRIVEPAVSATGLYSSAGSQNIGELEELSPTIKIGTDGGGPTPPVIVETYRKSRRAATSSDDETWVEADHSNTLNCFDGGDTRATEVVVERAFMVEPESGQGADLLARPTDHAPSLTAKNGQAHDRGVRVASHGASGAAVRRLTPLECERLQGLPDGWTLIDGTSDSARYRQLGNAVCANVAEWIACRIHDYIDGLLVLV